MGHGGQRSAVDVSVGSSALPPGRALRLMIVSDLDHTMVQNEDATHRNLLAFNKLWMTQMEHDGLLVYSTGRSPVLFQKLWMDVPLLTPNVLICSVGSEIFYLDPANGTYRPDVVWEQHLDEGGAWDRAKVAVVMDDFPELHIQAESEQRRHKLSYLVRAGSAEERQEVVDRLAAALKAAGLPAKVIFSGGEDVDVLSRGAGKGGALSFLLNVLREASQWPERGVLVCGDSGNDVELLSVPDVMGVAMAKSHEELTRWVAANDGPHLFRATSMCAGGIVQALRHFNCLPDQASSDGLLRAGSAAVEMAMMCETTPSDPAPIPGAEGLYTQAWGLARQVMQAEDDTEASRCWIDRLRITGGDGRWGVTATANKLAPNGTRAAAASRDLTAIIVRSPSGNFMVQDLQSVAVPEALKPSFSI